MRGAAPARHSRRGLLVVAMLPESTKPGLGGLLAVVALLAAAAAPSPAAAQSAPNPWQQVLSHVRSAAMTNGAADDMVSSWDRVGDSLRKNLADLRATLNQSVGLAEGKIRDVYVPALAKFWRWQVGYALWINPDTPAATCPEDPLVSRLLRELEAEALDCVRAAVPPGQPEVEANINATLGHLADFLGRARSLADECDAQTSFQSTMCKAVRLAPMGGTLGLLGGEVGRVAGQLAVLVDGSARQCLHSARAPREADAQAAAFAMTECLKTAGGNHGSPELERYYQGQVLANLLLPTR